MSKRIGLALSGGGYRAAAFHLGTLRALHTMGILGKLDVVSTISGGSITGAAWLLDKGRSYEAFEQSMIDSLCTKSVIRFIFTSWSFLKLTAFVLVFMLPALYILIYTAYAWTSLLVVILMIFVLFRFQFKIFPVSREIERAYDKFFFRNKVLNDLPEAPIAAIGSTNLLSTTPFTFSQHRMGDSYYDRIKPPVEFLHQQFPVARAVVASSCVPFAFTPVTIDQEFYKNKADFLRTDTKLVDGGVFDNQGIHKVTFEKSSYYCPVVIVSDAGNRLPFKQSFNNTIVLLIRTVDVFMDRIKGFQHAQNLYNRGAESNKEIAYLSLGWDIENCIEGFVANLIDKNIPDAVVASHRFEPLWLADPEKYRAEIRQHLEKRTDYGSLLRSKLSESDMNIARSVGTNLTKLSLQQVTTLARHAALLTELQVRLYCPYLVNGG